MCFVENEKSIFYEQFKLLCNRERIKPSSLARKLNMSPSAPGRWKSGSNPDIDTVSRIADYFGVSIDFLIRGIDTQSPNTAMNISNSAIMQGNTGNNVSVTNGMSASETLSEQEQELLRIFRGLTFRSKTRLISAAFQIEDEDKMQ